MTKSFAQKQATICKLLAVLLLTATIFSCCFTSVYAAAPITITYNGDTDTFVVTPNTSDLFAGFKDLLPGSTTTQQLVVVNQTTTHDFVQIYLEPLDATESSAGLLSMLILTVSQGDTELFSGTLQDSVTKDSWYLGEFAPNESTTLTLTLKVDPMLDNTKMYDVGTIDWRFSCVKAITESEISSTAPSTTESPSNTPAQGGSTSTTTSTSATATPNPSAGNTTNAVHNPQTGDNYAVVMYALIAIICFVLFLFTFIILGKKKKEKKDEE